MIPMQAEIERWEVVFCEEERDGLDDVELVVSVVSPQAKSKRREVVSGCLRGGGLGRLV